MCNTNGDQLKRFLGLGWPFIEGLTTQSRAAHVYPVMIGRITVLRDSHRLASLLARDARLGEIYF